MRVVNDFAHEENAFLGKFGSRLIGVIHGFIDAVAKPEFLGQPERETAPRKLVVVLADEIDETTVVVGT